MEIDYNDGNKYFDSTSVCYDITKSLTVDGCFYVRKDNGNSQASDFVDLERLSFRLSQGMIQTIKDFELSKYRGLKITLELE